MLKNPQHPPNDNAAKRALWNAVISHRIIFGTRAAEGSCAYAVLLSVIEARGLRYQDPLAYIAQTIALARKTAALIAIPA